MKLGVFVSEFEQNEPLDRLKAEKLGIFLVENGIYLGLKPDKMEDAEYYLLSEDLKTRGFDLDDVDSRVKVITYPELTDLIMEEYEKLIWL
jgi:sulfur relay protein TusB/DsrH